MAYKDTRLFRVIPGIDKVICLFCNTICGKCNASRHRQTCRQFMRFIKKEEAKNKEAKRMEKLRRALATDTSLAIVTEDVSCDGDKKIRKSVRKCAINAGRYVDPLQVVEVSKFHVNATVQAVFRQRLRHLHSYVPHVEECILGFFPIAYST
jgi:hypothetical protein